ncbi:MAG: mechanosensitive ion channel [Proteobacteria bacterium]|nr:mechanosensitive ion channel [Pseudomonadota bacterium]
MIELFHDISELTVIEILAAGMGLFIGLRLIQKGLHVLVAREQVNPMINRVFPIVEFSVWIVFLMWGAKLIFQTGIAGTMVLLVLMVGLLAWTGSFVVRDWIAGVVFKAEDRYRLNDKVSFRNVHGRLTYLGYRSLTIETPGGSHVEIPYSALVKESVMEKFPGKSASATFRLTLTSQESFPEVQKKIQTIVLCAPWSSIVHKPQIRLAEHQGDQYSVDVDAYLLDQACAPDLEAYVRGHM